MLHSVVRLEPDAIKQRVAESTATLRRSRGHPQIIGGASDIEPGGIPASRSFGRGAATIPDQFVRIRRQHAHPVTGCGEAVERRAHAGGLLALRVFETARPRSHHCTCVVQGIAHRAQVPLFGSAQHGALQLFRPALRRRAGIEVPPTARRFSLCLIRHNHALMIFALLKRGPRHPAALVAVRRLVQLAARTHARAVQRIAHLAVAAALSSVGDVYIALGFALPTLGAALLRLCELVVFHVEPRLGLPLETLRCACGRLQNARMVPNVEKPISQGVLDRTDTHALPGIFGPMVTAASPES
mmetsp:Transcript_28947/g.73190  ORF Transcript_28947/g.73190 Transcript_28947/m.73190 type:complete len:300 (-) Transcript_28947:329-1228(-)